MPESAREFPYPPSDGGRHRQSGAVRRRRLGNWAILIPVLAVVALIVAFLVPQWIARSPAAAGGERESTGQPASRSAVSSHPSTTGGASSVADGQVSVAVLPQVASTRQSSTADAAGRSVGTSTACPLAGGVLRVSATPEIADPLRAVAAASMNGAGSCRVLITAVRPADFIGAWQSDPAGRPDVWIPDSSIWLARAAAAGVVTPNTTTTPLVTSPAVLAISAATAARLAPGGTPTLAQVLHTRLTAQPVRVDLPDPRAFVPAVENLLAVESYVDHNPTQRSALTWAVGSGHPGQPTDSDQLLQQLTSGPATAVPVSEQAVRAHNRAGAPAAVAVYNDVTGVGLDYPFAVLVAPGTSAADSAGALLGATRSTAARQLFRAAGFRDDQGSDPAAAPPAPNRPGGSIPTLSAVDALLRDVAILNEPSRLLAVLDVSGSMDSVVPGSDGATRLDLARSAATLGLALYPSDSEVGVWVFSRNLTPTTDYRELVPVGPLTAVSGGLSGAQRVGQALAGVQVNPEGATGLYDTTLAAVRSMQARWDPQRVNAVLVLSDGQNDDQGGMSLSALLATLKAEQDSSRPVPVITIGLGPDSDVDALSQISQATGGAAYVAHDPRDIGQIFLDAVGQRLCRPHC